MDPGGVIEGSPEGGHPDDRGGVPGEAQRIGHAGVRQHYADPDAGRWPKEGRCWRMPCVRAESVEAACRRDGEGWKLRRLGGRCSGVSEGYQWQNDSEHGGSFSQLECVRKRVPQHDGRLEEGASGHGFQHHDGADGEAVLD